MDQDERSCLLSLRGGVRRLQPKRPQTVQPKKRRATVANTTIDPAERPRCQLYQTTTRRTTRATSLAGCAGCTKCAQVTRAHARDAEPEPGPSLRCHYLYRRACGTGASTCDRDPNRHLRNPPRRWRRFILRIRAPRTKAPTVESEASESSQHVLTAGQQARMLKAGWVPRRATVLSGTK